MELYQILDQLIQKSSQIIRDEKENILGNEFVNSITYGQYRILYWISVQENPTITSLSEAMNITKPSMTVHIQNLEKKGLVKKERSDIDKRSFRICLADKAMDIEDAEQKAFKKMASNIEKRLTEEEIKSLKSMLIKLSETNER